MQKQLPKPFLLLLHLLLLSNFLSATPDCPIVTGRFNLADGATSDPSATGWYLNASNVASTGYFAVKSSRLHAQELGGEGIWYSRVFSTAGYSDFKVAVKITSEGDMNSAEYAKIYYKINGGAEILYDTRTGNFGTIDFISPVLAGNNVQLVVKLYNYNNGGSQTSKYYIEEYRVFKEHGPCAVSAITVTATAGNGGILTCNNPSLSLSATATGSGATTYSWTGPGGYTAAVQNPVVSAGGTYTVVATNSTGTGSTSITVSENKMSPVITATGGNMACGSSTTISATSNIGNATYSWTGPNNFSSLQQNPTVSAAGNYMVTVTNPANGCFAQQTVSVTASAATVFWLEDFTLANGTTSRTGAIAWAAATSGTGTYSVQNNEFKTSFSGGAEGVWTSGIIDISQKTNVSVSVNVRSETAGSSDFFEPDDYIRVYYKLNGGAETQIFNDAAGIGNTTTGTATATATIASLNGSTLQIIIKTRNSDPTERYFFDNVTLTGTNAGSATVTPSVAGAVTCTATAQLSATASSTATAWSWTGPNGFSSGVQSPVVNAGGLYAVTATLSSGCTVSATVTVPENKTAPDITATGGTLYCLPTVTLNVNSSVNSAMYSWSGPNGFSSTSKNPAVGATGTYTATVTNPANGCTNSQQVTVATAITPAAFWTENFTMANGTTNDAGATAWSVQSSPAASVFSVQSNEFRISNIGTSGEGVWASGIINISGKTNITISAGVRSSVLTGAAMNETGNYADYIRFYYKLNSGAEVLFAEKLAAVTNHSTTNTTVSVAGLSGSSVQIVVRARATGNDEFYYFDNVQVTGAALPTIDATATAAGSLTCPNSTTTLNGSSSTAGVTFSWTGPNSFSSAEQNPSVAAEGIYTLIVTDPATGCSGTDTALVTRQMITGTLWSEDFTMANGTTVDNGSTSWSVAVNPTATLFSVLNNEIRISNSSTTGEGVWTSGVIDITGKTNVTISAMVRSSVLPGAEMNETGTYADYIRFYYKLNNGAEVLFAEKLSDINDHSTTNTPVSVAGLNGTSVQIVVRARATGNDEFYYFDGVQVAGASAITVDANASVDRVITCTNNSATITGTSATPGVTYSWAGPGGYTSNDPIATVHAGGTYTLTVSQGSCTASANVTVIENKAQPEASASSNNELTCRRNSTELRGTSGTPGVSYSWTGPGNFSAATPNATTMAPGEYILTVTDPANGCTKEISIFVTQDTARPVATATNNGPLSCAVPEVTLSANAATPGFAYAWSGPDGYSEPTQTAITYMPGVYTLTVTDVRIEGNGCSAQYTTEVTEDYSDCLTAGSTAARMATAQQEAGVKTAPGVSVADRLTYTAYPNPAMNGNAVIEFTSPQNAPVTVMLYNALGVCERTLYKGAAMANQKYRLPVPQQLSSGSYYYMIHTNGKTYSGRLIVVK